MVAEQLLVAALKGRVPAVPTAARVVATVSFLVLTGEPYFGALKRYGIIEEVRPKGNNRRGGEGKAGGVAES